MNTLLRWRWIGVALLFGLVLAMFPGAKDAAVPDNALTVWFLETDPGLLAYQEFQGEFGNDEVILLMVEPAEGVFAASTLRTLAELTEELEAVDGVRYVHSILTVRDAWETDEGLAFRPLIPSPLPEDGAALELVAARARDNALVTDRMVSADGKRLLVWIEMDAMGDIDAKRDAIVGSVTRIVDEALGNEVHALGGNGVIYSGLNLITQHDFGIFIAIGYLMMFVLMGWAFRSWRLVVAAIGVIVVGTLIAMGVYGWAGHQLNMVTVLLPTLVIVLGIADAVHFPAAFLQVMRDMPDAPRAEQVRTTMRRVAIPCVLTTVTTMAGFLSLASSPMAVIRHLGIYAAIGVGAALVATFVLMAVACFAVPTTFTLPEHKGLQGLLAWAEGLLERRRPALVALTLLLTGLAGWGASTVVTDTYTIGYLPDDHRVVRDHETIVERWGAYSVLDFFVRPADGRKADDPEVIAAMERFVRAAKEHADIRDGFSLADVYRRMASVLGGPELGDADRGVPLTPEQVDQLSLILAMQDLEWDQTQPAYGDNFLGPLTSEDRRVGRLSLIGNMISAQQLDDLLAWLDTTGKEAMQGTATLEPSGYPPLYVEIIDYVMTSQTRAFYIALGLIFLIMLAGFRSLRLALISLPPNIFPVVVMMGVMGALGIHLDVATATVGAIVIGVSIDDTVHFLHHWQQAERDKLSWQDAVGHTFRRAGVPAAITTLLLVGGFPVLMLAGVKTVFYFGLLTTVAAAAAFFGDVFILPLLLRVFPPRRA